MPLDIKIQVRGFALEENEERRIRHHLTVLERRLVHRPDPAAVLALQRFRDRGQVEADLRLQVGPLGQHLISRQSAATPDQAARLAVADVERQLERKVANQRGEHRYGVPGRGLPRQLRPALTGAERSEAVSEQITGAVGDAGRARQEGGDDDV
ncbi:MAG: hypothetical protein IT307_15130 [Chloroflexi bacterium]|nr:hypothetical protein [Chloroflexota bacterium]